MLNGKYRDCYDVSLHSPPPFACERKRKKGRKRPPLVNVSLFPSNGERNDIVHHPREPMID